jgi:hypothetical protein
VLAMSSRALWKRAAVIWVGLGNRGQKRDMDPNIKIQS